MAEPDDHQLLAQFAHENSEPAFAALVQRHVNLVYSVARRQTGNDHAAQEITQAAFIILAQKAGRISSKSILSGWLYQTTRLIAANFLRGEIRRQKREQEAYMQSTLNQPEAEAWPQIAPLLDDALARLGERDRNAIVLHFFENKSLREVGHALGASETAAKMRVNRALEKLRKIFSKGGVIFSATVIASTMAANSIQAAPAGLTQSATAVALAKGTAATTSTTTLAKGALKIMAWTKVKMAVAVGVGLLLVIGTTTLTVKEIHEHTTYPWQVLDASWEVLHKAPPQVKIVRTKYPGTTGSGSLKNENGKRLGIAQPLEAILETAYDQSPARTIFLDKAPSGKYDYIANLPSRNSAALQIESKRMFGLVGRRESREMDVLLLKVQSSSAPALKLADPHRLKPNQGSFVSDWNRGKYSCRNQPLSNLASYLEYHFKIPVIDQSELTNHYDIDLTWDETDFLHPNLDGLKPVLRDQLGLELVSSREPIEILVVEKAKD